MIKKHIKKVLCLVAILAIMACAFVVHSFAYEYNPVSEVEAIATLVANIDVRADDIMVGDATPLFYRDSRDFISDVMRYIINTDYIQLGVGPYDLPSSLTNNTYVEFGNIFYHNSRDELTINNIENAFVIVDGDSIADYVAYDNNYTPLYQGSIENGEYLLRDIRLDINESGEVVFDDVAFVVFSLQAYQTTDAPVVVNIPRRDVFGDCLLYQRDGDLVNQPVFVDNIPVGQFLWNSIVGFLSFEIVEGVSLYLVLTALVALPLCIWFLKLVAGG